MSQTARLLSGSLCSTSSANATSVPIASRRRSRRRGLAWPLLSVLDERHGRRCGARRQQAGPEATTAAAADAEARPAEQQQQQPAWTQRQPMKKAKHMTSFGWEPPQLVMSTTQAAVPSRDVSCRRASRSLAAPSHAGDMHAAAKLSDSRRTWSCPARTNADVILGFCTGLQPTLRNTMSWANASAKVRRARRGMVVCRRTSNALPAELQNGATVMAVLPPED